MSFVSRPMSTTDQFWQYAREALLSACEAETEDTETTFSILHKLGRKQR